MNLRDWACEGLFASQLEGYKGDLLYVVCKNLLPFTSLFFHLLFLLLLSLM